MCGQCGVLAPELNYEKLEIFQALMTVSVLRGPFGAGLAAVPKGNQQIEIRKNADITAAELVYSSDFWGLMHDGKKKKNRTYSCMMGHARQPTSGSYELEAIHPHHFGDIIGTHNGTFKTVNGKVIDTKKDIDSALFFQAAATEGVPQVARNSDGAYSLVWINRAADTISFLRNEQRPMFFAHVEDEDALYWASEPGMLRMVLNRKVAPKKVQIVNLNPNVVLSFRLHNTGRIDILNHQPLEKPEISTEIIGPTGPRIQRPSELEIEKIVTFGFPQEDRYGTMLGAYFTREDLDTILAHGCDNCLQPAIFPDYDRKSIYFFKAKRFMCHHCLEYDQTAQDYFTSHGLPLPLGIKQIFQSSH